MDMPFRASIAVRAAATLVTTTTLSLFTLLGPISATASSYSSAIATATTSVPARPARTWMTVDERILDLGPGVDRRLQYRFQSAGVKYPPREVVLVGLKAERQLKLYAGPDRDNLKLVEKYFIKAASGDPGPKLRQGDHQVPEGIYRIDALNPNSRFHVSLRVNYPNAFDRRMAARDNRTDLGGDIFLHGGVESVGCLALADPDIEEIFVLAADVGIRNIKVIISPSDLRFADPDLRDGEYPSWTRELYQEIRQALFELPGSR